MMAMAQKWRWGCVSRSAAGARGGNSGMVPSSQRAVQLLAGREAAGLDERDRLRAAADAELDPRRIQALVDAGNALLEGADLNDRQDEWVGARPVTSDGLPVIGATTDPRVFVAGGHGMWGVLLGPITGRLVAQQITTGRMPSELASVDPLRGGRRRG